MEVTTVFTLTVTSSPLCSSAAAANSTSQLVNLLQDSAVVQGSVDRAAAGPHYTCGLLGSVATLGKVESSLTWLT